MADTEKPNEKPETDEDDRPRESKAWPPPDLQNKSLPKPSGEK